MYIYIDTIDPVVCSIIQTTQPHNLTKMPQSLFSMEENLFSMSVPKCVSDKDKSIPQDILLSPILHRNCKNDIQQLNNNVTTAEEWLFSLDDNIISLENNNINTTHNTDTINTTTTNNNSINDGSCHNYYNMAQQNYQLWLASF